MPKFPSTNRISISQMKWRPNIGCMNANSGTPRLRGRTSSEPVAGPVVTRRFASAFKALSVSERSKSRFSNLDFNLDLFQL